MADEWRKQDTADGGTEKKMKDTWREITITGET